MKSNGLFIKAVEILGRGKLIENKKGAENSTPIFYYYALPVNLNIPDFVL
jgi:hypothetical protein